LPPEKGVRYKLIDIDDSKAVIVSLKTGTSLDIRKRPSQP